MLAPSFFALFITGLLVLFIVILFASNFKQFYRLNYYQQITLLSFITLAIGIHGLIHLGLEANYGFNPLQ
jgi:hypothetical protein